MNNDSEKRIIPFNIGGHVGRVVIYRNPQDLSVAEVQVWEQDQQQWTTLDQMEGDNPDSFQVQTGYWQPINSDALILSIAVGSGNFLSYMVFGDKNGQLYRYIDEKNLFQGDVWFRNSSIIYRMGNRFWTWQKQGDKIVSVPYKMLVIPGARVIYYTIAPNETIKINETEYTVPVGKTVQIIRRDNNDVVERMLISDGGEDLEYFPRKTAFRLNKKGTVEVVIIPGGYDWDKSVTLKIHYV